MIINILIGVLIFGYALYHMTKFFRKSTQENVQAAHSNLLVQRMIAVLTGIKRFKRLKINHFNTLKSILIDGMLFNVTQLVLK